MLIDGITLADLQVFVDDDGRGGLLGLFEPTESRAGRSELHRKLLAPESDPGALTLLQDAVRFFAGPWRMALLGQDILHPVERYLHSNIDLGPPLPRWLEWPNGLWLRLREPELCRELRDGVRAASDLLIVSSRFAERLLAAAPPQRVAQLSTRIIELFRDIGAVRPSMSFRQTLLDDRRLRQQRRNELRDLIACVAELDALRTMGSTTRERGWTFPEFVDGERFVFEGDGLHHPFLEDPVGNPVRVTGGQPVIFLTGPNMAGKTTYMKAVGLAAVLAHQGMGVPASRLRLTPMDVVITGLNPSDNIRSGLSFFFAEVLRVKEAALQVASGKRCLLLFDEVFKGTNVRDALNASEEVITGFAHALRTGCVFSSHLVELAESLAKVGRIQFVQLEGEIVGGRATYSYRLLPGVSDKRFGRQILSEAGVSELMRQIAAAAC